MNARKDRLMAQGNMRTGLSQEGERALAKVRKEQRAGQRHIEQLLIEHLLNQEEQPSDALALKIERKAMQRELAPSRRG